MPDSWHRELSDRCARATLAGVHLRALLALLAVVTFAAGCTDDGNDGPASPATTPATTSTTVRRFRDATTTTVQRGATTTLAAAEPCPLTPELVAEQFPGRTYELQQGSEKRGRNLTCMVLTADRSFSVNALTVASSPEAFVRVCENLRADPVAGIGDDACWTDDGLLAVLVDDDLQLNVAALDADEAGEADVQRKVLALAEAILDSADL